MVRRSVCIRPVARQGGSAPARLSRSVVPDNRADEHCHRVFPYVRRVGLQYGFGE
jgi:hypothetical protein